MMLVLDWCCATAIAEIAERMSSIRHKVAVLSGKGGVGKSTFVTHLAHAFADDESKQVRWWKSLMTYLLLSLKIYSNKFLRYN